MRRWFSSAGFDGSTSRILAFSCLTVVVAATWGKLKGCEPGAAEMTWRVKLKGSGASSSLVGASLPEGTAEGSDMVSF